MSFFQDIPPPLDDDKSRDGEEFDLDDEEIEVNKSKEHSEIQSDFDVYNSSMKPPELSSALFFDTTPPPDDDFDPSKISHDDSFDEDPEFHFHENNLTLDVDEKAIETNQLTVNIGESGYSTNSDEVIKSDLCENSNLEKNEDKTFPSETYFKLEDLVESSSPSESHENLFISAIQPQSSLYVNHSQLNEPKESEEDDVNEMAISSFSTSLAFDNDNNDKSEGNLHNEFTVMDDINPLSDGNYAEVIAFNDESLSDQEEKNNQAEIDKSDIAFDANFNNDNEVMATDSVQELKLEDDSDDDFNDFETAIPMHRHIETQNSVNIEQQQQAQEEIHFEADFSAFEAFSEAAVIVKDSENILNDDNNDDDDDFGDFNDFTQVPVTSSSNLSQETHSIDYVKSIDIKGLLNTMFSSDEQMHVDVDKELEMINEHSTKENLNVIKSDDIVKKLDDFDGTLALGYLYNNSTASQILVKALGIDTRNILLGAQWSSSSNMPRYASNLSFNPLEPLKPVSTTSSINTSISKSELSDVKISAPLQPKTQQPDVIPEVEFDWNSSGLVNPLDGKQPNPQSSIVIDDTKAAVFKSTTLSAPASFTSPPPSIVHAFENESLSNKMDEEEITQQEVEPSIGSSGVDLDINVATKFPTLFIQTTPSGILVRERTIKLPETHIFTPVKSTSPVSREVISNDDSTSTIVVKEYHDIEYSLEPKRKTELENEFDDFQSAPVEPSPIIMPSSLNILEPQKVLLENEICWPNPGNVAIEDDFNFIEDTTESKLKIADPPTFELNSLNVDAKQNQIISPEFINLKAFDIKKEFSKPVIGNSPTKQTLPLDDDFADFQTAPIIQNNPSTSQFNNIPKNTPIVSNSFLMDSLTPQQITNVKSQNLLQEGSGKVIHNTMHVETKHKSNEPITLSPSRLVSNMKNQEMSQKPSWILIGDDDEVKRYEAAFAKCKVSPKPQQKTNNVEEEEWNDFVGANIQNHQQPSIQNFTPQNHQPIGQNSRNYQPPSFNHQKSSDEWSDFVSAPTINSSINSISSQILSKPNFTSWNQPISRPYVHHATSFLSRDPTTSSITSSRSGMNITNNFSYHNQQNGISTIPTLPTLDFAGMSKNSINYPRNGSSDNNSGKK